MLTLGRDGVAILSQLKFLAGFLPFLRLFAPKIHSSGKFSIGLHVGNPFIINGDLFPYALVGGKRYRAVGNDDAGVGRGSTRSELSIEAQREKSHYQGKY